MVTLEFSQEELHILNNLFTQISCKLEDAALFLPLQAKIQKELKPLEEKKTYFDSKEEPHGQ